MRSLQEEGVYRLPEDVLARIQSVFSAGCADEAETEAAIGRVWRERDYLCDPHTAVAFSVAEEYKRTESGGNPLVILSTASPYKFPAPVLRAVGGDNSGDEFEQMDALRRLSGVPVPANLASLRSRQTLHRDEIGADELLNYVLRELDR